MLNNNYFSYIVNGLLTTGALCILSSCVSAATQSTSQSCHYQTCVCLPEMEKPTDYIKDEVVLSFPKQMDRKYLTQFIHEYGVSIKSEAYLGALNKMLVVAKTSDGVDAFDVVRQAAVKPSRIEATTNNLYKTEAMEGLVSTPINQYQEYALNLTGVGEAQNYSKGKGVIIGMIDTPVDLKHVALKGDIVQEYVSDAIPLSYEYLKHGTAVAGVMVSSQPNIGIAPEAKLLAISAFSANKSTGGRLRSSTASVARAIQRAIKEKVDILNMSFAGDKDRIVASMVKRAHNTGMLIVAASGNDGQVKRTYPAALKEVIAVTAVDHQKRLYTQANRGDYIDISAPGVGVISTAPGDRYRLTTGTSIAAAHVTGALALLNAKNRTLDDVVLLADTAADLGTRGRDTLFGYGLVNVIDAMRRVVQ